MKKEQELYSMIEPLFRFALIEAQRCGQVEWSEKMQYMLETYHNQYVIDHVKNRKNGALAYKWNIANMQLAKALDNIHYGSEHVDNRPAWLTSRLQELEKIKAFN